MKVNVVNMYKSIPKDKWYTTYKINNTLNLYCGRPSVYGNPYTTGTHEDKVKQHKEYWNSLTNDSKPKQALLFTLNRLDIKELNLVCFCKPKTCHCDNIKDWIEKELK